MTNHWLVIALVAYLIGAAIEGISTASQLSHSAPELAKNLRDQRTESASPSVDWRITAAITLVSICGAFIWPCRLIHRLMKINLLNKT